MSPMDQLTMKLTHYFVFILSAFHHACAESSHPKPTSKNTKQREYSDDIEPDLIRSVSLDAILDKLKLATLNIFPGCIVVENKIDDLQMTTRYVLRSWGHTQLNQLNKPN